MNKFALVVAIFALAGIGYAATSNLDNHGLGDSAATANTFTLRDANGLSAIPVVSTTALATVAYASPLGTLVLAQESVSGSLVTNTYNLCHSTANAVASWVYLSVSTSAAAKVGASCSN